MARGDTAAPSRAHFSEDADDAPVDRKPKRLRYPCRANQCPMPGVVDDQCGWHYRESGGDWSKITQVMLNWECVTQAINTARRTVTDPLLCVDVKGQEQALRDAWARMLPSVEGSGWRMRLEPRFRATATAPGENIGEWGRRLEVFLGARIKSDLMNMDVDERKPTPAVEEMRRGLRSKPLGKDEWDGP